MSFDFSQHKSQATDIYEINLQWFHCWPGYFPNFSDNDWTTLRIYFFLQWSIQNKHCFIYFIIPNFHCDQGQTYPIVWCFRTNGLVQERCNSSALAMALHFSCTMTMTTNPTKCKLILPKFSFKLHMTFLIQKPKQNIYGQVKMFNKIKPCQVCEVFLHN